MTALLETGDVSKFFGYRQILEKVCLNLHSGELVLLTGPNGAGKSTLLKIISGLMRPSAGSILYRQKSISEQPEEYRRAIGVISHDVQFYNDLTALENLIFFGRLRSVKELNEKAEKAIVDTGLSTAMMVPVKNFSSGMKKRLNIARIMIAKPEILLLDEPYTGLDFDSIDFFNRYLEQYKRENGSVLMISHQLETCLDLYDRIAQLRGGRIQMISRGDVNERRFIGKEASPDEAQSGFNQNSLHTSE